MNPYVFDIAGFRTAYPAFADNPPYTDALLQGFFDSATCYIDNCNFGALNGNCRYLALTLMTAHLAQLYTQLNINPSPNGQGQIPVIVQSAGVDKVNVSLTPPPIKTQFQWWCFTTTYGMQCYSLLQQSVVGGLYVTGVPIGTVFRNFWGVNFNGGCGC